MDGFAFFGSCLLSGVNKRSFKKLGLRLFENDLFLICVLTFFCECMSRIFSRANILNKLKDPIIKVNSRMIQGHFNPTMPVSCFKVL